jgi:hypothetical protein
MTYVKYLDKNTVSYAPRNLRTSDKTILNFNKNPEIMRQYGFKPLCEADSVVDYDRPFHIEYKDYENEVKEVVVYDALVDDDPAADHSGAATVDTEQAE